VDLEFSDDQQLLRATVARLLAERAPIAPFVRARLDDPGGVDAGVHEALAGVGAFGLLVPASAGGTGAGMTEAGVVAEESGRALYPGPWIGAAVAAAPLLDACGERSRLPDLAAGSWRPTLAVYEPGRRYSWRAPATTATRTDDGWRVDGTKSNVLDGVGASAYVVTACAADGLALLVVDANAPGVTVTLEDSVDRTRATARVELDGVDAARLDAGEAAAAEGLVEAALDRVALALVLDGVGAASAALAMAREYALQRVQFGRPVGAFQAVQHLLVDILTDLECARAGAYYALWALDHADACERHRAASLAKAWAASVMPRIGADALQVFAGVGFTWEHDIHLFYKRLLSVAHLYGDEQHHLDELAALVLDELPVEVTRCRVSRSRKASSASPTTPPSRRACSAAAAPRAASTSSRAASCAPSASTKAPTTSSCRRAAGSGRGRTATCRSSARRTRTSPATASARSTSPRDRACSRSCSAPPATSRSAWRSRSTSRRCARTAPATRS
jgi:alkylation response protein AidB-like acyl-CoA dehydrogenase